MKWFKLTHDQPLDNERVLLYSPSEDHYQTVIWPIHPELNIDTYWSPLPSEGFWAYIRNVQDSK